MKTRQIKERKLLRNESFPEDIDGRLNAVLSSVNTEPKQVQLILMNDEPKTYGMIKKEFSKLTSGNFDVSPHCHGAYCFNTFVPIGLSCEESITFTDNNRAARAWSINDVGKQYAWPIAAFTLKKANEYGKSFFEILGPTHTHGDSRSPYNRFMILDMLSVSPMSFSDLSNFLNIHVTGITDHIKELKKCGFVDFDSINVTEPGWSRYAWVNGKPEDVKAYSDCPILTRRVADELYRCKESDYIELGKALGNKNINGISGVLVHLEKLGFAEHLSRFGNDGKSEVILTDDGCQFHEDYVKMLSDAFNSEKRTLDHMRDIYNAYMKDRDLLIEHSTNGVSMYGEVSNYRNRVSFDDRCKMAYEAIAVNDGIRSGDITRIIGTTASMYIDALIKSGKIYKEGRGHSVIYRATEKAPSIIIP